MCVLKNMSFIQFKFKKRICQNKGLIVVYVLVFGAIFLVMMSGLFGFSLMQLKQTEQKNAFHQALAIAEAGIDYYRWCLGNGIEEGCAGEKDYYDGQGRVVGKFLLQADLSLSCGQVVRRQIVSTGWTVNNPAVKRNIKVVYGRESIAKYTYILNSNVWIGGDHAINGPYHSNGGIRMDGANQSVMSSATMLNGAGEWVCTNSFGCSPCPTAYGCRVSGGQCVCPGIFSTTANANTSLFQFPQPPFDFNGITMDLADIKYKAQNRGGLYLPPSSTLIANGKGYHLKFLDNGTAQVWVITSLSQTYAYSAEEGYHYDQFIINEEILYGTYSIPADCSVIYLEDNLWPEGAVKGKVIVASANLITSGIDTSVVLPGNITYAGNDGADGLALIAEQNILIGPQSPDNMELRAIMVAQKGRFGRNHYSGNFRNSLKIYGSVVSNGRVGTQWVSGSTIVSGYANRETNFDKDQVYNPPPFVAYMNPDFKIVSWEEIE